MIISQPDRVLLQEQISAYTPLLKGDLLDIGAGSVRRYFCPNATSYRTLDCNHASGADIIASAEAIPLPDNCIDSILCTQVLEHVAHPNKVLQEIYRLLRPGGLCLLTAPQMNELHEEPHDYFRYTCFGLRVLFEDTGFVVEHLDQRGGYHATLAQMRIREMINQWRPYERTLVMWLLAPWSNLLTRYALWRDTHANDRSWKHAIGWCVLAKKP